MIPVSMLKMDVMLCERSSRYAPLVDEAVKRLSTDEWLASKKIDGVRCVAFIDNGTVRLQSRARNDMTAQWPDVAHALGKTFPTGQWVFDGEVVGLVDNVESFAATQKRHAWSTAQTAVVKKYPGAFIMFDILFDGRDLRKTPLSLRNTALGIALNGVKEHPNILVVQNTGDVAALWAQAKEEDWEGIVVKKWTSLYTSGRNGDWVKLKRTDTVSVVVTGLEDGKGARASTFGSLNIALVDENFHLVPVGAVGSGFNATELKAINARVRAAVRPLIIDVEYQSVTASGQLRHPVFKNIRSDVDLKDCTVSQLAVAVLDKEEGRAR